MKTSPLDFILCAIAITLLVGEALAAVLLMAELPVPDFLAPYRLLIGCVLFLLFYGLLSALHVRLLLKLRPLQAGEFDMSHPNFTYWKFLVMMCDFGRFSLLPFTILVLRPVIAKLFGAKMGSDVAVSGVIDDPYLVSVGNGSVVGHQAQLCGSMTTKDKIFFGRVVVGERVIIGVNAVILPDVEIGDDAVIGIGSVVMPGTRIGMGEVWRGNPARKWESNPAGTAKKPDANGAADQKPVPQADLVG